MNRFLLAFTAIFAVLAFTSFNVRVPQLEVEVNSTYGVFEFDERLYTYRCYTTGEEYSYKEYICYNEGCFFDLGRSKIYLVNGENYCLVSEMVGASSSIILQLAARDTQPEDDYSSYEVFEFGQNLYKYRCYTVGEDYSSKEYACNDDGCYFDLDKSQFFLANGENYCVVSGRFGGEESTGIVLSTSSLFPTSN